MTVNRTEAEERDYLKATISLIREALQKVEIRVSAARSDIIESKKYVWTNRDQLDAAERAANTVEISLAIDHGEKAVTRLGRLKRLAESPYFGRVDFIADDRTEAQAYYIGVHSFSCEARQEDWIYDWRSPAASMFYDFNAGRAYYLAPEGEVAGEISLKRQYRIRQGTMEYMIESSMNINDDVLQRELSQTSDEKMKNIVATIQQEQNAIIRNENARELIIQGAAGSGKTSVALHRVAFLLYRYQDTLTSRNILIVSPNKVFADYISNVLPELGEEKIAETGFGEIAAAELAGICEWQTFAEQVSELAEFPDGALVERIRYKAKADLAREMDDFVRHVSESCFCPADLFFDDVHVDKERIAGIYQSCRDLPFKLRLEKTATLVAASARDANGDKPAMKVMNKIKSAVRRMAKAQLLAIYKDFYAYIGRPELFRMRRPGKLEFADVFPMVYLKIRLEGAKGYQEIKHLLVDEMQDYTPIQYAVLSRLFACRKTILGDCSQTVNPYSSSSMAAIKQVLPEAETVELLKSYRSTVEIIEFARQINPAARIVPIERHGARPQVLQAANPADERLRINEWIALFKDSGHRTLGIVCKTQAQAARLHEELSKADQTAAHLLDFNSKKFHEGVIVTSAHMAKGLEFDRVVVPFVDASNYRTELDRSLLYIACTRAMHMLALTFHGEPSSFISDSGIVFE